MRVVVYVSKGVNVQRVTEALTREGHEVVGLVKTPAEAQAAITSGTADRVVTANASKIFPWLMPTPKNRRGLVLIPALIAAWWADRRTAVVVGVATASVMGVAMLPATDTQSRPPAASRDVVASTTVEPREPEAEPEEMTPVSDDEPLPTPTPSAAPTPTPSAELAPSDSAEDCRLAVDVELLTLPVGLCVATRTAE